MSKAFKCDVCGKLYEGQDSNDTPKELITDHLIICRSYATGNYVKSSSKDFDICPNCFSAISEMILKNNDGKRNHRS